MINEKIKMDKIRQMSLSQYAKTFLDLTGRYVPEGDSDAVRAAFSNVSGLDSLRGLFNSAILAGYQNVSDSLEGVYTVQSAPNYLLSELGVLSVYPRPGRIARGGTAPSASFAISSTGYRLAKYGIQFCLDDQDIDDNQTIGLYQIALAETGSSMRRLVQDLLWSIVLKNPTLGDGAALFAAGRGNLGTAGLSDAPLGAGMSAIAGQTSVDENSDPVHLGLSAKYLLVPPAKIAAAKQLVRNIQTGDSTDLVVRGESRLSTTGMVDPTDADDAALLQGNNTNWMLAATGSQAPSLILAALNGQIEPTIRSYMLDKGQWGIGFDVYLSVAAAAVDGKPLYWSSGTA